MVVYKIVYMIVDKNSNMILKMLKYMRLQIGGQATHGSK